MNRRMIGAAIGLAAVLTAPPLVPAQVSTAERLLLPGWWPTKGDFSRADYVGPRACAACHTTEATSQKQSAMASAGGPVAESAILATRPSVQGRIGPFTYQILRQGNRRIYSVSRGTQVISVPLLYAFGLGIVGQTYIFRRGGAYYESHVSFFPESGLDITIGHSRSLPSSFEEALGRRMDADEFQKCFACHTTAAVTNNRLEPSRMIPGVTCEACHGPGSRHVAAMKAGQLRETFIFNPGKLSARDSIDFCGACHRTWLDVKLMRTRGIQNVRFQPYRLENSKCWVRMGRIACLSCHNPHEPPAQGAAFYDSKCLACHLSQRGEEPTENRPGPACPVNTRNCVNCHMPKYRIPGVPFEFTDHQIRVVPTGERFPS